MTRFPAILAFVIAAPLLAGCETTSETARADSRSVTASLGENSRNPAAHEDLKLGKEHFRNGNFGLAEKHFRLAVEQSQDNLEAVVGLAASYDQLGRFELSDRLYADAMRISGGSAVVLNNRGYSYYLRRDFRRARTDFQAALRKDPANDMAKRNLVLLGR
ncbi:MAG: tetratricopeptide repeat protein [Beijerinckiaceae bacterium]